MKGCESSLPKNSRGAAAVEFAIAVPVLLMLILGILQVGLLLYASAGLHQGVNEGARYATIYPGPTDAQIKTLVVQKAFGLQSNLLVGPTVTHGVSDGVAYVDVSMTYSAPLDFLFLPLQPVTLQATRRSFQY